MPNTSLTRLVVTAYMRYPKLAKKAMPVLTPIIRRFPAGYGQLMTGMGVKELGALVRRVRRGKNTVG